MNAARLSQKAFTLVEILIVLVVLSLIVAGTTFAYRGYQDRARDAKNEANAKSFVSSLEHIAIQNGGKLPTTSDITNSTWQNANGFKASLYKDSENLDYTGIGNSTVSSYVSVLIPDYTGDSRQPCAAMIQVKSKRTSNIANYYIDLCPEGASNFTSFPKTGCPSTFEYISDAGDSMGNDSISANATTGFCEIVGSALN